MLKIYIGNIKDIKARFSQFGFSKIKFSKDILNEKLYGLFYEPTLYYFLYNKEYFSDKDSVDRFIDFCNNTDSMIVCVCEEKLDKKSVFFKHCKQYIEEVNSTLNNTLDMKTEVLKDLANLYKVEDNKFVSLLYSLSYTKYKQCAGFVLSLILTGRVSDITTARKIFLVLATGG